MIQLPFWKSPGCQIRKSGLPACFSPWSRGPRPHAAGRPPHRRDLCPGGGPSVSPLGRRVPGQAMLLQTWAASQPLQPFPELADRAVCAGLGRAFQAAFTARPFLPTQLQQTQTDHHNPARLAMWGWHRRPWRWGAGVACGQGSRCELSEPRQPHKREEAAGGREPSRAVWGRRPLQMRSGGPSSRAGLQLGWWGHSSECRRAPCDSRGCGPKATSRQMGKSAFCVSRKICLFV